MTDQYMDTIPPVLDIPPDLIKTIQTFIDEFEMGIKRGGGHWIAKETLYTHAKKGGIGMIDLNEFITSIKCS